MAELTRSKFEGCITDPTLGAGMKLQGKVDAVADGITNLQDLRPDTLGFRRRTGDVQRDVLELQLLAETLNQSRVLGGLEAVIGQIEILSDELADVQKSSASVNDIGRGLASAENVVNRLSDGIGKGNADGLFDCLLRR